MAHRQKRKSAETDRPPYQPWYESDFWTFRVRKLHPIARLMYRSLLQHSWDLNPPGQIPNDIEQIKAMCDCWHPRIWATYGEQVLKMFDLSEDKTVYTNARQCSELAHAAVKRASYSRRGVLGNEVKYADKRNKINDVKIAERNGSEAVATKDGRNHPIPSHPIPNKTSCAETKLSAPADSLLTLPLNDKSEYPVLNVDVVEWVKLYPAVDVRQQLRNMRGWLLATPAKRKTASGVKRFINNWLSKAQNNPAGAARYGSDIGAAPKAPTDNTAVDEELRRQFGDSGVKKPN